MAESDGRPEDLPPRVVEGRVAPRQRSLLSAKLANDDGSIVMDCTIRDLSDTGARIALKSGQYVSRHVFLVHSRSGLAFEAEVTWMRPPLCGLKFLRSFPRDDSLAPELAFLKRLYV